MKYQGFIWAVTLMLGSIPGIAAESKASSDTAAFEKLKSLAGEWDGKVDDRENGSPVKVIYKSSSNGSIVTETLFAGTEHEMITVYYLDQSRLVLVHYCAAGNQPRMALSKKSTPDQLLFDFAGGTNLDASKDVHMHSARIQFESSDSLRDEWESYKDGKSAGAHTFFLKRKA